MNANMDESPEAPVSTMAPYRTAAARLFSPIQRVLDAGTGVPTHMSGSVCHTASGERPFPFTVLGCAGQMLAQLNKLFRLEHECPDLYTDMLREPAAGLAGFLDSAYPIGMATATTLELAEVLPPHITSGRRPPYSMDCQLGASNFDLWRCLITDAKEISGDLQRLHADTWLAKHAKAARDGRRILDEQARQQQAWESQVQNMMREADTTPTASDLAYFQTLWDPVTEEYVLPDGRAYNEFEYDLRIQVPLARTWREAEMTRSVSTP